MPNFTNQIIRFRYLKFDHMYHCVPESVSSGLATLPVSYVYTNGIADTSQLTTKKLPTGEALNGSTIYAEHIFPFFTSNDITIEKTLNFAYSHLAIMYNQVSFWCYIYRVQVSKVALFSISIDLMYVLCLKTAFTGS